MPNMKTQKSQEHYVLRSNEGEERYHPNVFHSEWFKSGEQGEGEFLVFIDSKGVQRAAAPPLSLLLAPKPSQQPENHLPPLSPGNLLIFWKFDSILYRTPFYPFRKQILQ